MFGDDIRFPITTMVAYDPAADDVIPIWRAPQACEIKSAGVIVANTVAASTANYFDLALLNLGTAGTGTIHVGGTIGGTAGFAALTYVPFTLGTATKNLAAGEILALKYNEEGTGTFTSMAFQAEVVWGT